MDARFAMIGALIAALSGGTALSAPLDTSDATVHCFGRADQPVVADMCSVVLESSKLPDQSKTLFRSTNGQSSWTYRLTPFRGTLSETPRLAPANASRDWWVNGLVVVCWNSDDMPIPPSASQVQPPPLVPPNMPGVTHYPRPAGGVIPGGRCLVKEQDQAAKLIVAEAQGTRYHDARVYRLVPGQP